MLLQSRKSLVPSQIPFFNDKPPVADIAAGARHSLVLTVDGTLYAFGDNAQEQCASFNTLRVPEPTPIEHFSKSGTKLKFRALAAGDSHNVALTEDGSMYSWGGEGGLQTAGTSVNSHQILAEVDCVKGRVVSKVVLAH